jgi:hypothetical protein
MLDRGVGDGALVFAQGPLEPGPRFLEVQVLQPGGSLAPRAFPEVRLPVSEVLGL